MSGGGQLFEEFIDDYFSECDEHLGTVRRVLLEIEAAPSAAPEATQLHDLARALHTLKGLSGMVGLAAAEEIAHAMEDAVRLFQGIDSAPPELVEALFVGARLLEDAIESKRSRTAAASPGPYVDRVRDVIRMIAARGTAELTSETAMTLAPSNDGIGLPGPHVYRFEFVPSQGLAARGVGVESIRRRLSSIGQVTTTTPRVRANGTVAFEFTVSVGVGKLPDEAWRADGLSWEALPDSDGAASVGMVVRGPTRAPNVSSTTASNVVRVDLSRLDELMRLVGELVVSRARLGESVAKSAGDLSSGVWEELNEMNAVIERQIRIIREGVMRIRLVSIGEVFERMRFAMRDIARETGKEILLEVSGQDIEIDKLIVDRMLEPLLHLVRNAASHGIEPRDHREAIGKRAEGTIALRARAAGDRILLEVEDDGAGVDIERVTDRARKLGLSSGTDTPSLDVVLDVICSPGFSTREVADLASGRGIGMAVVQSTVRGLGGELFLDSVAGHGTRFTIELPLTLMITDALLVEVGDQAMAIPQSVLREILPLDPGAVTVLENNELLSYRGRVVPLINLSVLFNRPTQATARRHVLIVGNDLNLAGLLVDGIVGLREIVVHPVADPLVAVPGVAGATELADGRVSLILDAPAIVRWSRDRTSRPRTTKLRPAPPETVPSPINPEQTWV